MEIKMTAEGLKNLEDRLNYLKTAGRAKVIQDIETARSFGDLSENAEYDAARAEQGKLESEIAELEATLRVAVAVSDDEITNDKVNLGTTVTVEDLEFNEQETYSIVGAREADPMNNMLSPDSPYGMALMSKKVGDIATVQAPDGEIQLKIISIARTNKQ